MVLGRTLGSRGVRPIELVEKMEKKWLATAMIYFSAPLPVYSVLCSPGVFYALQAWARLLRRSPLVEVHDLSPRSWSSTKAKQPTDCLGDVDPM